MYKFYLAIYSLRKLKKINKNKACLNKKKTKIIC